MTREEAEEACEGEPALFVDGFDNCIIGVSYFPCKVAYNVDLMITFMMQELQIDLDESLEHMAHNIEGAYMGENTPLFIYGFNL